jgi:transcriptional/translational regulatory protein YebC/TACO1
MQKALEEKNITVMSSELEWIPSTPVTLPEDQAEEVLKLVAKLEQDEDVQQVFHNLA